MIEMKAKFLGMLIVSCIPIAVVPGSSSCKDPNAPINLEAGAPLVNDICSLITGINRNVCATVEEIAQVISFIVMLRSTSDAGALAKETCSNLPKSTFCSTMTENDQAILFLIRARSARLMLDAGGK